MSKASDYAARQAIMTANQADANASAPAPFVGPNGSMSVGPDGSLVITPGAAGSNMQFPAAAALAAAAWIIDTFGD